MNTGTLRILLLFVGLVLAVWLTIRYFSRKSTYQPVDSNGVFSRLVIEVRRGGGRQPEPHPVWISIYSDGLIRNQYGEHHVDTNDVKQLIQRIDATGLFDISHEQFDAKLKAAGEFNLNIRGGSGVYTISFESDGKMYSLLLNQPELYANSTVPAARQFLEVLKLIEDFVSK